MAGFNCSMTRGGYRSEGVTCRRCFRDVMPLGTKCPNQKENDKILSDTVRDLIDEATAAGAVGFKINDAGGSMISRMERLQFLDASGDAVHVDCNQMLDSFDMVHVLHALRNAGFKIGGAA